MDRQLEACLAAERILDMIHSAGFDINDPHSIIDGNYGDYPNEMQYRYGASRLVVWDTDYCDYVIKVALDDYYDKYCQHEVEVYRAAVEAGIEDSFAWCMCYSESDEDHVGIYVMEYLDCDEEDVYDSAWQYGFAGYCDERGLDSEDVSSADEYNDWKCGEDSDMIMDYFESMMDNNYRKTFEMFLCNWNISDLHEGNWGYAGGRQMKIVDYAGWGW